MTPAPQPLRIAVVGHTNTGKTSLLRTLTRDPDFGEVADRPGVTRDVAGTALLLDGQPVVELHDTPGLEDPIGLLDSLLASRTHDREEGPDLVHRFLASPAAAPDGIHSQEAKALRQLLESHVALVVIDARDPVLAKHRDELRILSLCARPILPVLNFTARSDARPGPWREHLARVGLHAVAEFDTVVVAEEGEQQLYEKLRTLLDARRPLLDALIADRRHLRSRLIATSHRLIAELLIDVAALRLSAPLPATASGTARPDPPPEALDRLRQAVRSREQDCVARLLRTHRFHPDDCQPGSLPLTDGRWGLDLFHPDTLRRFGVHATSAAAAGAVTGLVIDAAVGGISLGAAAVTGAVVGAVLGAGRSQGRRVLARLRGRTELRCDDATLHLLAARQSCLLKALLARGHASQHPVIVPEAPSNPAPGKPAPADAFPSLCLQRRHTLFEKGLPAPLHQARAHPGWARPIDASQPAPGLDDPAREAAIVRLTTLLATLPTA